MSTQADKKITIPPRSTDTWRRLRQAYGTKFVDQFGPVPSPDWIAAIEDATQRDVDRALETCRKQDPIWPPTLPQFENALQPAPIAAQERGPTIIDQLEAFSRSQYQLTWLQERRRTWLYSGKPWDKDTQIVGVSFPADGDNPGYRVMVADMQGLAAA